MASMFLLHLDRLCLCLKQALLGLAISECIFGTLVFLSH